MKKRLILLLILLTAGIAYAATRNVVPRADGEGGLGTSAKNWLSAYVDGLFSDSVTFTDNNASPDAVGELLYDNTLTGLQDGGFVWYDDDQVRYLVDLAALPVNDDYVIAYDAAVDNFYMKADADSGGATAWDDIGNPDAAATVDFVTYTQTIDIGVTDTGGPKTGLVLDVTGLGAGTTDIVALEITTATDDDTDFIPLEVRDDSGTNDDLLFQIDSTGTIQTGIFDAGAVTSSGSVTATTSVITPLLDAAGAEDMDYGSVDVTDHTFVTDSTGDAEVVLPNDSIGPAEIDSTTGAYDFGGVTSLEIPNGANPTTDADGEIAYDTDDDAIEVYDGSTSRLITAIRTAQATIWDPDTLQSTEDAIPLLRVETEFFPHGITIKDIWLAADASNSGSYTLEEWTDPTTHSSDIETVAFSSATEAEDDGTLADSAVAAGNYVFIDLDTTSLNWLQITFTYYVNEGD